MGVPTEETDRTRPFEPERTSAATTPTPTGEVDEAEQRAQTRKAAAPDPRQRGEVDVYALVIDAGGVAALDVSLHFTAQSFRVDNFSQRWLHLPGIDCFIPPGWYGLVRSMDVRTRHVRIVQRPPGVLAAGAIVAGQVAIFTFYEAEQGEVDGEAMLATVFG